MWIYVTLTALLFAQQVPLLRPAVGTTAAGPFRLASNLCLWLLCSLSVQALMPGSLESIAADLQSGILRSTALPPLVEVIAAFLLLDCWRYWEHRAFHEIGPLWRAHAVHHSDIAVDVSTSQRHHPLEALLTAMLALLLVFAFGFSVFSLAVYFAASILVSLVNHTALQWPGWFDLGLRRFIATPAVHYVHHSAEVSQTNSNYGSVLTIWDQLFGTWSDPATAAVERVGLEQFRSEEDNRLLALLAQPFHSHRGASAPVMVPRERAPSSPRPAMVSPADLRPRGSRETVARLALLSGILFVTLAAFLPTARHLADIWASADSYHYAWLVLPVFVWLAATEWRSVMHPHDWTGSSAGVLLALAALLLHGYAATIDVAALQHLALALAFIGVVVSFTGTDVAQRAAPLLLLLFFAVPAGDLLLPSLRAMTLHALQGFFTLFGETVQVEGYRILIGDLRYAVVDDCAGLPVFLLCAFLGYAFGLMLSQRLLVAAGLSALFATIAVVSNWVRVCLIVAVDLGSGTQMPLARHDDVHFAVLAGVVAIMLIIFRFLSRDTVAYEQALGDRRLAACSPAATKQGPAYPLASQTDPRSIRA